MTDKAAPAPIPPGAAAAEPRSRATRPLGAAKPASVVAALLVLRGLANFGLQVAIAARYGAGSQTDAYFLVIGLYLILGDIVGGVLTNVALPILVRVRTSSGEEESWNFGLSVLTLSSLGTLTTCLFLLIMAPGTIHALAPGFHSSAAALAADLLRFGVVGLFLYTMSLVVGIVLQSHERFATTAAAPVYPYLLSFLAFFALPRQWGVFSLMLGFTLGSGIALTVQMWQWSRLALGKRRAPLIRHCENRRMFTALVPMAAIYGCLMLLPTVSRMWASSLEPGSVSVLGYANQVIAIPTAILVTPLGTVLFPRFSALVSVRNWPGISHLLKVSLAVTVAASALFSCLFIALAHPIVTVLFERGSFAPADVERTASVLMYLALGLFATAGSQLMGRLFAASERLKALACVWGATVALFLILVAAMPRGMGVSALGLALSIAYAFQFAVLFLLSARSIHGISLRGVAGFVGTIVGAAAISTWLTTLAHSGAFRLATVAGAHRSLATWTSILVAGLVGSVCFSLVTILAGGREIRALIPQMMRAATSARPRQIARQP